MKWWEGYGMGKGRCISKEAVMREKRKVLRWRIPFLSFITRKGDTEGIYCSGKDISFRGMRILSPIVFEENEYVEIIISFPAKKSIWVSGKVIWERKRGEDIEAGIEFIEIKKTCKAEIKDYVTAEIPSEEV